MTPQRAARIAWPVVVGGIFSTLSVARVASNWLRDHGVLRLTVAGIFLVVVGGMVIGLLRQARFRSWRLPVVFMGIAVAGVAVGWQSETPEERLHLVEYGAVALLTELALPQRLSPWPRRLLAALVTLGVGCCDELVQGLLPTRHFDVHDIVLNAESGVWALASRWAVVRAMPPRGE